MKDQYFGDVNDYRKYGLLRTLTAAGLSIGVCWLLTEDDQRNDGELRRYLTQPSRWRRYDPELYDKLQWTTQHEGQRSVRSCSAWGLVPGAVYFDEILTDDLPRRQDYFRKALKTLGGCDIVFFDPDNGIEVPGTPRGKRGSSKYVYWIELREAYEAGHSLLVYQHYPRVDRTRFVSFLADRIGEELHAPKVQAFATPYAVLFLVRQSVHTAALDVAATMVRSTWSGQVEVLPPVSAAV